MGHSLIMYIDTYMSLYTEPNVNWRGFQTKSFKLSKIFTVFVLSILCDVFVVACALSNSSLEKTKETWSHTPSLIFGAS